MEKLWKSYGISFWGSVRTLTQTVEKARDNFFDVTYVKLTLAVISV